MRARVYSRPCFMSGSILEALYQRRDRQRGWVGDEQVDVVGFAVELGPTRCRFRCTRCGWCVREKVSMASVNSGRRELVTKTRCGCSSDTGCRARR